MLFKVIGVPLKIDPGMVLFDGMSNSFSFTVFLPCCDQCYHPQILREKELSAETSSSLQRQLDEALGRRQQLEHTIAEQTADIEEYKSKMDETKSFYENQIQGQKNRSWVSTRYGNI